MQALIVGLVLAGVSATSLVAFRHPLGYARLFPFLVGSVTVVFMSITVWQVAVEFTWRSIEPLLDIKMQPDAVLVKDGLSLPYSWIALVYIGCVIFFWINLRLPPFLQGAEEPDETL